MSKGATMSMKPEDLDNPERNMDLTNRDPRGTKNVQDAIANVKRGTPMPIPDALKARIERARTLKPSEQERNQLRQLSTADCFERGRDAAIRAIEGDE